MIRLFIIMLFFSRLAISQNSTEIPVAIVSCVEDKLIAKLKAMHDPANVAMFSRAFVGSVWKYTIIKKPAGRDKFYLIKLEEYRGAFVIDQHKARVIEKDCLVLVEDWTSNKYVTVEEWLKIYANAKNKK